MYIAFCEMGGASGIYGENRNAYRVFVGIPAGKLPLERSGLD
jgi:hypothetical protein